MFQSLYFIVFVSAVIIGIISLTPRDPMTPSLMKRTMDQLDSVTGNKYRHVIERFSVSTDQGVQRIREQMKIIEEQNQATIDHLKDQKMVLEEQRAKMKALMSDIDRSSSAGQLKELASAFDDQERLLIANGQQMMELNDQVKHDMQNIKDQMGILVVKKDSSSQEAKDRVRELNDKVESLMEQQRLALEKGRDIQTRNREESFKMKQRLEDVSRGLREQMEINSIKADEAKQKAEDQKQMIKERIADQMQRIKDQQVDQGR